MYKCHYLLMGLLTKIHLLAYNLKINYLFDMKLCGSQSMFLCEKKFQNLKSVPILKMLLTTFFKCFIIFFLHARKFDAAILGLGTCLL